ncbi:MAG: FliM/FliN family flagellar motor switch protein [Pseudomonadota bacterium]|nr:MAG: FliM/FliN family flagellar motor switch protein [Pseudomonadota bacterium]
MNQLLTQDELDALLRGDSAGRAAESEPVTVSRRVRTYDIANGERTAANAEAALQPVNRRFARMFQASLFGMLRCAVKVTAGSTRADNYGRYARNLQTSASINLVTAPSLRGAGLCVFDGELVSAVVENYFGGYGRLHTGVEGRERNLTELHVIDLMLGRTLRALTQAWRPVTPVQFEAAERSTGPCDPDLSISTETVAISTFHIELKGAEGELHLALPCPMLEPVRGYAALVNAPECGGEAQRAQPSMLTALGEAHVELCAFLAETRLSLAEVMGLKVGDILPIPVSDAVTVKAGDSILFHGTRGTARGQVVVTVSEATHAAGIATGRLPVAGQDKP